MEKENRMNFPGSSDLSFASGGLGFITVISFYDKALDLNETFPFWVGYQRKSSELLESTRFSVPIAIGM